MYLCYLDESGTSDTPGNTSHFVLAGVSIPIENWKDCDRDIDEIKRRYRLETSEVHIAWILRPYLEQSRVSGFRSLSYDQRRAAVERYRKAELLRLQRAGNRRRYQQAKKNLKKTADYIHLTREDRFRLYRDITNCIARWGFARLFAECIDKVHFDPARRPSSIDQQAFEQIVSRFEHYLGAMSREQPECGLLIHDNNETIARKYTNLMKQFLSQGTLWTEIDHIIETPLVVDSALTSLVQIADVCAYALRRYLENGEEAAFNRIFRRADRRDNIVVGVRHFTSQNCECKICTAHRRSTVPSRTPGNRR